MELLTAVPTVATSLVAAVFALSTLAAAHLAARRAAVQPIPHDPAAEATVVATVTSRPEWYARVALLEPEAFSVPELRRAWGRIVAVLAPFDPDVSDADPDAYRPGLDSVDLAELLGDGAAAPPAVGSVAADVGGLLAAGRTVLGWWQDRQLYRGSADWQADESGALVRRWRPPSLRRQVVLALMGVAAGLAAVVSAPEPVGAASWWAHLAALAVLSVVAAVVASVDFDTLLIDLETTVVGVAVALVPAGFVAFSRDGWRPVGTLVLVVVALLVLLRAAEWVTLAAFGVLGRLRRLRARSARFDAYVADRSALTSALGSGDLWLIPAAFGVPYLLVGTATSLVTLLGVACVTAVAGHVVARLRGRGRFAAFGPHLMWAWVGALLFGPAVERVVFGL